MIHEQLPHNPEAAHALIRQKLNEHTEAINRLIETNRRQDDTLARIEEHTSTLVKVFDASDGAFTLFKWVGRFVMWVAGGITAVCSLWYVVTNWLHKGP